MTLVFDVWINDKFLDKDQSFQDKTLTIVVGMTMILDDFLRQWMLQKAIILF